MRPTPALNMPRLILTELVWLSHRKPASSINRRAINISILLMHE